MLPRRNAVRPIVAGLALAALAAAPLPLHAQTVKPWSPPNADSLSIWAAEARALFRAQTRDTVDGTNFRPFDLVGGMARRLLRSLGNEAIGQGAMIEPVLDSLGLETAVRVDPTMPHFVLMTVRNPERRSSMAIGFVFWFRGRILHQQGVVLSSGQDPRLRVWFTGAPERPYTLAILDRSAAGTLGWTLLGLSTTGDYWNVVQSMDRPGEQGRGQGDFLDLNGDARPELVLWTRGTTDPLFTLCSDCPGSLDENILVERAEGFVLQDTRRLTTPFVAFSLFVHYLQEQNRVNAARLLADPAKLDAAIALGWGQKRAPGSWSVEYGEPGESWPRWLAIRYHDAKNALYIVHFTQKEGRWVIRDWVPVRAAAPPPPAPGPGGPGK